MKVAIASDHGGFDLKEIIIGCLQGLGYAVEDCGTNTSESCDYPDYGIKCAEAVANGEADRGIVVCGTGIGISISANKVKGIRCALCTDKEMAKLASQHNNANMIALGGRTTETIDALEIVETWLSTAFEGGRHQRRIDKISEYEKAWR